MAGETRFETVCIRRHGGNARAGFGMDAAAYVVYQGHVAGEVFDPREGVKSVWLVPLANPAAYVSSYGRVWS